MRSSFYFTSLLLACLYSSSARQEVTVGLDSSRKTIYEADNYVELCVVLQSKVDDFETGIDIRYTDKSAVEGIDFMGISTHLEFDSSRPKNCFKVKIIDDYVYEPDKEFSVNLYNYDQNVSVNPDHSVVVIRDDDNITIGWEHEIYTVRAEERQVQVYINLSGIVGIPLPKIPIEVEEGTAKNGLDFVFSDHVFVDFPEGSNSKTRLKLNIELLDYVDSEKERYFNLIINPLPTKRLKIEPQKTTVVIKYYVQNNQKPTNTCEGINNLISSSSTPAQCSAELSHSENCDFLICLTKKWRLSLLFLPCGKIGWIRLADRTQGDLNLIYETFPADKQFQRFRYVLQNQAGLITLNTRVIVRNLTIYYLISLKAPQLKTTFQMTAIPFYCGRRLEKISQHVIGFIVTVEILSVTTSLFLCTLVFIKRANEVYVRVPHSRKANNYKRPTRRILSTDSSSDAPETFPVKKARTFYYLKPLLPRYKYVRPMPRPYSSTSSDDYYSDSY